MPRTKRIAELEAALSDQSELVAEALARYRGIEAQLESLRAGVALVGDLVGIARTEAILSVLRQSDGTLSPIEIVHTLHAAKREDDSRSVTATLTYLLEKGSVERVGRGRYLAA
jgi:hypothetical protein